MPCLAALGSTLTIALAVAHALVLLPLPHASAAGFTRESSLESARAVYAMAALPADVLWPGTTPYENVTYTTIDGAALQLDLYAPAGDGPHPVVLIIHGGGWETGERMMERPLAKRLAALGFAAVPVSYRLGPAGRYPAALHDLKSAVRWLRANAATYHIDPARIGVIGGSAGGHLAALLGATNGIARFEGAGACLEQSSTVAAVVDIDGVVDFTGPALLEKERNEPGAPIRFLSGTFEQRPDNWREASPLTHVGKHCPPTLFITSTAARPILPGRPEMCGKLQALGIDSAIVVTPDTPHPFWLVHPWFEPTAQTTAAFLRKHLSARPVAP